jgi:predicted transposase/invertase (TIGR01784 family)
MFDTLCKFLAESFSEDYATWLLGRPVTLTKLSPTELSLEPIRADSLILEQSEDLVLHIEFKTEPDEKMGFHWRILIREQLGSWLRGQGHFDFRRLGGGIGSR